MATEGSEETSRCSYFENLFSPYISGSLDKFDRRALADHLRECGQCAEQFGLSHGEMAERFKLYTDHFDVPSEAPS